VSERIVQLAGSPPQFSLRKSFPGFGPIGPWLVTVDEFSNPDNLELGCSINGETPSGAGPATSSSLSRS
jgi:2-keto-4-pentenoate hydratase/2-oxohepta-3-ene-1,7-dioic acid hydratase in catechol pathway